MYRKLFFVLMALFASSALQADPGYQPDQSDQSYDSEVAMRGGAGVGGRGDLGRGDNRGFDQNRNAYDRGFDRGNNWNAGNAGGTVVTPGYPYGYPYPAPVYSPPPSNGSGQH